MRLTELNPAFVAADGQSVFADRPELTIKTAQGIRFLDPLAYQRNGGPRGCSTIVCWFRGRDVPFDALPGPGRWTPTGRGFEDLSLSPSVDLTAGGKHVGQWHGFITNGQIVGGL